MAICCNGQLMQAVLIMEDKVPAIPQSDPRPDLRGQLFTSNTTARTLGILGTSHFSSTQLRSISTIDILMKRCSNTAVKPRLKSSPWASFLFNF